MAVHGYSWPGFKSGEEASNAFIRPTKLPGSSSAPPSASTA